MNILFFTAGAASMYCGSCLRDNALAAELKSRGHDVLLQPLYTPILTDEPNVSEPRVLFGGIGVYLQQHVPLLRRTPWLLDRLWDSPRLIKALSSRSISTDPGGLGELTISMLKGEEGHQRKEFEKLVHWLRSEAAPDVVQLPNALLIGLAGPLRRELDRPVLCTLQGEDLFLEGLRPKHRETALALIRGNIAGVDRFIAVSEYYARFMSGYLGIPSTKIDVVPLGINVNDFARRHETPARPFTVGYLARIAPEKGLHVLCDAYVRFRRRPGVDRCRLEVAGYLASSQQPYLDGARQRLAGAGLGDEFGSHGSLERGDKVEFLRSIDVLSVPTTYVEPKGLFVLEAMACGVPVVQPRHGAFPEMVTRTSGGILVEPDVDSLADGLYSLWRDPALRATLGQSAYDGVRQHYTVAKSADRLLDVYRSVVDGRH